jgi:hypothetical protein
MAPDTKHKPADCTHCTGVRVVDQGSISALDSDSIFLDPGPGNKEESEIKNSDVIPVPLK